jgi:hypothetical protein
VDCFGPAEVLDFDVFGLKKFSERILETLGWVAAGSGSGFCLSKMNMIKPNKHHIKLCTTNSESRKEKKS